VNKLLQICLSTALLLSQSVDVYAATVDTRLGKTHSIYPEFVGVNGNLTSIDKPWQQSKLVEVTNKMAISNIRYPAGTLGNTWDWSIGWVDQDVQESDLIKWVRENKLQQSTSRYTLDDFAVGLKKTNSAPVFMLNMLTKDLQHSIDALKHARDLGMEVKYIELGNEIYFNIPLEMRVYPTPEDLGKTSKIWIDALKKEFPDAKYAVVGTTIRRRARHENWNARVLEHATNADAITLHMYTPFSLFGNKEVKNYTAGEEGSTTQSDQRTLAEIQQEELAALADTRYFTNMLTNVKEKTREIEQMAVAPDLDIWVTEFNVRGDKSAIRGSWANSLVLAVFYDQFLNSGQVKLSNVHNIVGNVWEMVYQDNPLHHVVDPKAHRKPWSLSAGGLTTRYFSETMSGMTAATAIKFEDVPVMLDIQNKAFEAVSGYVFRNDKNSKKTGIIINYSDVAHKVNLGFTNGQGIQFSQTSAALTHYVMDEDRMEVVEGQAKQHLTLAPFSITTFSY
jgi:hypothetical protein